MYDAIIVGAGPDPGYFAAHGASTLAVALSGFAAGSAVAIGIATLMVHSRLLERALYPLALFVKVVPLLVWGRSTVDAGAAVGATEVSLRFPDIEPSALEVEVGHTVRLVVRNDDWALHTFTMDGLDVDYPMRPRSSRLVEFTPTEAGEYRYFCRVLGHDRMKGTLVVR